MVFFKLILCFHLFLFFNEKYYRPISLVDLELRCSLRNRTLLIDLKPVIFRVLNGFGDFLYGKETIRMQPWQIVDLDGYLYYAFLPVNQPEKLDQPSQPLKEDSKTKETSENVEDLIEFFKQEEPQYQEAITNFYMPKIKKENCLEDPTNKIDKTLYPCEDCDICFPVQQMLKRHRNAVHDQSQRYKCKVCSKICRSLVAFKMHVALEHKTEEHNLETLENLIYIKNSQKKKTPQSPEDSEEYTCDICEFKCHNKRRLKDHLERKHASEYKHECEFCGKKFKVKGDMRLHVRFKHKEGPIICDVCGKTCSNSNSLYVHQKWAHFKPKFECEICKRRMVTQENLDQHVLLQHERRESFVCEECGKAFSENHRLKQHMMTHTGDRPYDCHVCGKAFARRTGYRQHLLIHTGKRPYICDICGKAFTQKPGLICHRKSHPGVHPPLPVVHIEHILNDFMKKK